MEPTQKVFTPEEIEKFRERRQHLSEALKGRKAWNKGKKWSQEVKDKISATAKAQFASA